jgi:hypothetical protein
VPQRCSRDVPEAGPCASLEHLWCSSCTRLGGPESPGTDREPARVVRLAGILAPPPEPGVHRTTSNQPPTSNRTRGRVHWILDYGCWLFDVRCYVLAVPIVQAEVRNGVGLNSRQALGLILDFDPGDLRVGLELDDQVRPVFRQRLQGVESRASEVVHFLAGKEILGLGL